MNYTTRQYTTQYFDYTINSSYQSGRETNEPFTMACRMAYCLFMVTLSKVMIVSNNYISKEEF